MKKNLDNCKKIICKLKLIYNFTLISSKLSDLVDNLSEKVQSDTCPDCKARFDYLITKDDELMFRCFDCKQNYQKDWKKNLINRFANTYQSCHGDINKFLLLLKEGVYPYEYMDIWEKFDET